jgi:hypothetical protein
LIDLENCPGQIQQLKCSLDDYSQVVICYANGSPRVPLDWVGSLASAMTNHRLRVIRMGTSGKNAADFGISFFAGSLMQELPKETHFTIISNDTDLDHVVGLLKSQGRGAERVGYAGEKPEPVAVIPADNPPELPSCCAILLKQVNNRPGSEGALKNSLKAACGQNPLKAQSIFEALVKNKVIAINSGKLSYDDQQLKKLRMA